MNSWWGIAGVALAAAAVGYGVREAVGRASGVWLSWGVVAPAVLVLGVVFYACADAWVLRGGRSYQNELRRRRAVAEQGVARVEAERDAVDVGRRALAEVVVTVRGFELPHGDGWLVRVWLWADGEGLVERRVRLARARIAVGEGSVSREDCERVRELAGVVFEGRVSSGVMDGAPADVEVWVPGRGVVRRGWCNLAGLRVGQRGHPIVRIVEFVREVGGRVEVPGLEGEEQSVGKWRYDGK